MSEKRVVWRKHNFEPIKLKWIEGSTIVVYVWDVPVCSDKSWDLSDKEFLHSSFRAIFHTVFENSESPPAEIKDKITEAFNNYDKDMLPDITTLKQYRTLELLSR